METKWMLAPSYVNAEILKVDEKTKKAYIKEKCPRCGGLGFIISRVENGQMIPIPVDGGVCYKCNSEKYIYKWVKAYTEKEYESYIKATERRKAKEEEAREKERQERINKSEETKKAWLLENGYDVTNPTVYIVAGGNTYEIKDELKEAGFRFNKTTGWYSPSNVEVRAPFFLIPLAFDDVFTWAYGRGNGYIYSAPNAYERVKAAIEASYPESDSEYIGEEKERLRDLDVTVSAIHTTEGFYGTTFIYTFNKDKDVLVWMTPSCKDIEVGENIILTGTVKTHKEYKKVKQTILSRCIVKKKES